MVCSQNTPQRAKPRSSDRSQINWWLIMFIITSSVCVCVCVWRRRREGGLWRSIAARLDVIHGLRREKKCSQGWVTGARHEWLQQDRHEESSLHAFLFFLRFGSEDDVWDFYCCGYLWVEKVTVQSALTAVKVEEVSKEVRNFMWYDLRLYDLDVRPLQRSSSNGLRYVNVLFDVALSLWAWYL